MAVILVIEDEAEIRELIALHLKRDGHQVFAADSAESGFEMLTNAVSLVVLDWMLPGESGLQFVAKLRHSEFRRLSVLMVTAKTDAANIVAGLEAGADDYVTKPFDAKVFLARVKSLLRRSEMGDDGSSSVPRSIDAAAQTEILSAGGIDLDLKSFSASCLGNRLELTISEFKLLAALIASRGRVLTRGKLIEEIQGQGISVVGRTIDTHIFELRKKLGTCADAIETVRGVGYRITPD